MAAGIEIQVGKIRGPWLDIVVERIKKHYVMGIITAHGSPGFPVTTHTAKPEVLPGVWKLTPYSEKTAGGIQLIGIQAELFPQDFKRINGLVRRWRFKLVVYKAGVGFFEIEGVAVVSDNYITRTEEVMQLFYERPVVVEPFLIPWIIGERPNYNRIIIGPPICEGEDVPIL